MLCGVRTVYKIKIVFDGSVKMVYEAKQSASDKWLQESEEQQQGNVYSPLLQHTKKIMKYITHIIHNRALRENLFSLWYILSSFSSQYLII